MTGEIERQLAVGVLAPVDRLDDRNGIGHQRPEVGFAGAEAEAAMIGQDMSRAKRAEKIDSHAAAIILQGAIDALVGNAF